MTNEERARLALGDACGRGICLQRVAAAIDDAVRAEREACAETCDGIAASVLGNDAALLSQFDHGERNGTLLCAAAIRARSKT